MVTRLEMGRRYHCREISTSKQSTGIFWRDADAMEAKLFDYDSFLHFDDGAQICLQLEDNSIVSMLDTIVSGPGSSSYLRDPPVTTYFTEVTANTLVVGHRPWLPTDPIRRVRFSIPHSKAALTNLAKKKSIRTQRFPVASAQKPLFEIQAAGLTIRCWYSLSGSFDFGTSDWEPLIDIEFDAPRTLDDFRDPMNVVLRFFSAATGFHLTPKNIVISPLPRDELISPEVNRDEEFSVEYVWSEAIVEKSDLHLKNCFVHSLDRKNLTALKACLRAWISREEDWREATMLMMGSLGLLKEVSGRRLLMACRWLEAIPGAAATPTLDNQDIRVIAAAATEAATKLGHGGLEKRIEGLLRTIKSEPNDKRFQRLVKTVRDAFGGKALGDDESEEPMVATLMRAMNLRGREAHGVGAEGDADFLPMLASTSALEALCYLLTIKDLPMTEGGRERAVFNRVVRANKYAQSEMAILRSP